MKTIFYCSMNKILKRALSLKGHRILNCYVEQISRPRAVFLCSDATRERTELVHSAFKLMCPHTAHYSATAKEINGMPSGLLPDKAEVTFTHVTSQLV